MAGKAAPPEHRLLRLLAAIIPTFVGAGCGVLVVVAIGYAVGVALNLVVGAVVTVALVAAFQRIYSRGIAPVC